MYSIAFPNILNPGSTNIIEDHEATKSNLELILKTTSKNWLFGDPYYGTNLDSFLFMQNNYVTRDLIREEIYTAIQEYIPQLKLTRDDIEVESDNTKVTARISAVNLVDNTPDMYSIELLNFSED